MTRFAPGQTMPRTPLAEVAHEQSQKWGFIGLDLLGGIPVPQRAGERAVFDPGAMMGVAKSEWAFGGDPEELTPEDLQTRAFSCRRHGYQLTFDKHHQADIESEFNVDADEQSSTSLWTHLMRAFEARAAKLVFNTTTFAPTTGPFAGSTFHSAGPKLNKNPDTANVETLIRDGQEKVEEQCGVRPDTVVLSQKTVFALSENAKYRERVIYTVPAGGGIQIPQAGRVLPNLEALANLFEVDRVLVARSRKTTSSQRAPFAAERIWSPDMALFAVTGEGLDLENNPRFGGTWYWEAFSGPGGEPFINPPFDLDNEVQRRVVGFHFTDAQVFAPQFAHLFTGIDAA